MLEDLWFASERFKVAAQCEFGGATDWLPNELVVRVLSLAIKGHYQSSPNDTNGQPLQIDVKAIQFLD